MADRNSYLQYKRDTKHLIYWLIRSSNAIIKSSPELSSRHELNDTGQIAMSDVVPVSKLVAEHGNPVPAFIFRLFQATIGYRSAAYAVFQRMVAETPDPDIERSNACHKHFIEVLSKSFTTLGGEAWVEKQKNSKVAADDEEADEIVFANTFAALGLGESKDDPEDASEEFKLPEGAATVPTKQKAIGKRKKGKKAKPKASSAPTKDSTPKEVPLESYRIIEDEVGIMTDYLMATYAAVKEWVQLRKHLQGVWREVAYGALNSAVAGELSTIAVAMVKQTESTIFVEFPGHESYETIKNTITRGNIEKAMLNFSVSLHRMEPGNFETAQKVRQTNVDVKEEFLIHTYQALVDFANDFKLNRNGKPTKRMLAEINNWNPSLNLQKASEEVRLKWRRSYTINWLYDLVNVFSSIVVQRINLKGQKIVLEDVDWSPTGPWEEHRRLFGLNEFAGEVTALAMQKPTTDIRPKILPHTVFQLQCIVDALTGSRGWSSSTFGHVFHKPADNFRPRRDVDLFLDRQNKNMGRGYCQGVSILKQLFERDAMLHGDERRHKEISETMVMMQEDFINWLGESKYMSGLNTIPPSRFSNTNSNGLWEYSPYLCGVGLMEALELAHALSFCMMDQIPEPLCIIHLHNMLVQKGIISREVGLYASLQEFFADSFFADGQIPTRGFSQAFVDIAGGTASKRDRFRRRQLRGTATQANEIHGILNVNANRFFKTKSILALLREANWNPDRIPDEVVPWPSMLGTLRLSQTKHKFDPKSRNREMEDTALVRRARASGLSDEEMIQMASSLPRANAEQPELPEAFLGTLPEGYTVAPASSMKASGRGGKAALSGSDLLTLLKVDIHNDVSGGKPTLSLNYVWVMVVFMMKFMDIEDKLRELRNPYWIESYQRNPLFAKEKRLSLTGQVLASEDEECMKVIAEVFQNPRNGFMQHLYWDDLEDEPSIESKDPLKQGNTLEPEMNCSIM